MYSECDSWAVWHSYGAKHLLPAAEKDLLLTSHIHHHSAPCVFTAWVDDMDDDAAIERLRNDPQVIDVAIETAFTIGNPDSLLSLIEITECPGVTDGQLVRILNDSAEGTVVGEQIAQASVAALSSRHGHDQAQRIITRMLNPVR